MQVLVPATLFSLSLFTLSAADVVVYSQKTHKHEMDFQDLQSTFGGAIPLVGQRAFLIYAKPPNACSPLAPPPNITNFTGRWAVLIQRNDCNFEEKVRRAQNASYDIAIVHNVNSSTLVPMHAPNPDGIYIPSIFVGSPTGQILKENYQFFKGYYIIIDDAPPFDINTHLLLPFALVTAICFITMIVFMVSMIVKCIKDHRRARRHRLTNSTLRQIPTAKYRKGDPYETCAICLEDYVEGEKLRILPCSHAYHCACIDPWLTRNRRVCPVCKRKVFGGSQQSDSDSATDDDDNTPLLNTAQPTQGGTFTDERHAYLSFLARFVHQQQSSQTVNSSSSNSVSVSPEDGPSGLSSFVEAFLESRNHQEMDGSVNPFLGSVNRTERSDSSSVESYSECISNTFNSSCSNPSLHENNGEEVEVYSNKTTSSHGNVDT